MDHLVQLPQEDLSEVKCGEADPDRNGPFHPVHTETFVQSTDDALLRHYLLHRSQDGAVRVACDPCCLHATPHHVQRVRCRLANETRTCAKYQSFIRVGLLATAAFYMRERVVTA